MTALIPSFRIYREGKIPVQTLWAASIERRTLNLSTVPAYLCLKSTIYRTVLDLQGQKPSGKPVPVVISLQQHSYGNFAVIRIDQRILNQSNGKATKIAANHKGKKNGK